MLVVDEDVLLTVRHLVQRLEIVEVTDQVSGWKVSFFEVVSIITEFVIFQWKLLIKERQTFLNAIFRLLGSKVCRWPIKLLRL